MRIEYVEIDVLDFEGVDGAIHAIAPCSLAHAQELRARLQTLSKLYDPNEGTLEEHYVTDNYFKFLADRCLALCGVDPAWVSLPQLTALLFPHQNHRGEWRRGWLIDLNFHGGAAKEAHAQAKAQTYAEQIAALSVSCGSEESALRLAAQYPGRTLAEIVEAKSEIIHQARMRVDKKYAENHYKREAQRKAKADLQALQQEYYGQSS